MQRIQLNVINEVGLHARPASEFVKCASGYRSDITVRNVTADLAAVDAKSILSVLTLGVEKGHQIEVTCEGEDEVEALQALRTLIESDFGGMF